MTTGFGTPEQRRAYIVRCLADGATVAYLAWHLGLEADEVRRIAAEPGSETGS